MNFNGKHKNLLLKIHNDVRFAIFCLKTSNQIKRILKSHDSMKKKDLYEISRENIGEIE